VIAPGTVRRSNERRIVEHFDRRVERFADVVLRVLDPGACPMAHLRRFTP
jgi:hypothetical protein